MHVWRLLPAMLLVCLNAGGHCAKAQTAALPDGAVQRLGGASDRLGAGVTDYAYLPDGRVVLLRGTRVEVHDLDGDGPASSQTVSKSPLANLSLRPDGRAVLFTDRAGLVRQWDLAATDVQQSNAAVIRASGPPNRAPATNLRSVPGPRDITYVRLNIRELGAWPSGQTGLCSTAYSPDGRRAITVGSQPTTFKEWDVQTGQELHSIDKTGGMVQFNQGLYAADGRTVWIAGGVEHVLEQYDPATGECLTGILKNYNAYCMELSADGKRLLIGSRSYASEWDLTTQKQLRRFAGHHGGAVGAVAYCRDPERILTGSRDGSIRLWDRSKGEVLNRWYVHQGYVRQIRVSPDGKWMLSSGDGRLVETSLESGEPRRPPQGHRSGVSAAVFLPGRRAASASTDGSICVWDLAAGKSLRTWQTSLLGVHALAAVAGGKQLAAGCGDGQLRLYETDSGTLLNELPAHLGYVRAVVAIPGGNRVATSADDGCILVHDLAGKSEPVRLTGHRGGVLALAASPDGKRLISGGRDCSVRLWDATTGKPLAVHEDAHPGWVLSVCFSPDGRRAYSSARDGRIVEWDLQAGTSSRVLEQKESALALVCDQDGRLFSAYSNGRIGRWDLATGKRTALHKAHQSAVLGLALSPDAKQLLSASSDSTLLVWQTDAIK